MKPGILELLHKRVRSGDLHGNSFQGIDGSGFMADYLLVGYNACFDRAEKLAASPEELRRVKHARLSLRYVEVYRQATKAAKGTPDAEKKKLALGTLMQFKRDCEADGIVQVKEGGSLQDWYEGLAAPLRQ